jgi:hypothetical protein
MDFTTAFAIMVLVIIGSRSLESMGRYLPRRREYSYLYYDETEYKLPFWALFHFWVFVGSYILTFWIIWSWGTT